MEQCLGVLLWLFYSDDKFHSGDNARVIPAIALEIKTGTLRNEVLVHDRPKPFPRCATGRSPLPALPTTGRSPFPYGFRDAGRELRQVGRSPFSFVERSCFSTFFQSFLQVRDSGGNKAARVAHDGMAFGPFDKGPAPQFPPPTER
jgi:hypothetical protein